MLKKITDLFPWKKKTPPVPQVVTPFHQKLKQYQRKFLMSFIFLIFFSSLYSYFYIERTVQENQIVEVWVAKTDLKAPKKMTSQHIRTLSFPKKVLPEGAFLKPAKVHILQKTLFRDLKKNEIILASHLQKGLNPSSISAKFDSFFAFSLDESWLVAKIPTVKNKDLISIMVSNPREEFGDSQMIVDRVKIIAIQTTGNKKTLVLNTTIEEAQSLLLARSLKLPMQLLVHSAIGLEE